MFSSITVPVTAAILLALALIIGLKTGFATPNGFTAFTLLFLASYTLGYAWVRRRVRLGRGAFYVLVLGVLAVFLIAFS